MTTGFVAGIYLPVLDNKKIEEIVEKSKNIREIIVTKELLLKGAILVVWNTKTHNAEWEWIDSHRDVINVPEEKLEIWRNWRRLPNGEKGRGGFKDFIKYRIGDVKWDAYGVPGGIIEPYEYESEGTKIFGSAADYENSGEHYSDYAFHREWVEETGLLAIGKRNGKMEPLFERVIKFWEDDKRDPENPEIEHEDFFFLVKEVEGKMNDVGVKGETLAPEIVPMVSLHRGNFYTKHAHGLMAALNHLIKDGREEYRPCLKYLQNTFPPSRKLRREPKIRKPELSGLSDAELFAYTMNLDKSFRPLAR